jgi:hypothetical protein
MAKLFNRAKVNTATVGTGTITLGAAVSAAFCTFAEAGVANGDKVTYIIEDGTNFEIGVGTYTSAGTTLSRDTVRLSKISGVAGTSKINLSGAAIVYIAPSKEDISEVIQTLTPAATIAWDMLNSRMAQVTLTASGLTFGAPTNMLPGSAILFVKQDGTGGRTVSWNAVFKWPGGVAPTLSTAPNATEVFSFVLDGTSLFGSYMMGLA